MKNESHSMPLAAMSRAAVIIGFTERAIRETDLSWNGFAMAVVPHYRANVPRHQQHIKFSCQPDLLDAARVDAQKLKRHADAVNRLPVELEESWVQCLPPQYRRDCIRALAWRYGLIGAFAEPLVDNGGTLQADCLARLTYEFSEALAAASHGVSAGLTPEARALAIKELKDLQAETSTMLSKLNAAG